VACANPELSEGPVTIPGMTRSVPRTSPTLPPLALTPEQAAAIAVALAAQPEGPYAAAGREALDAVVAALEPDPRRREALLERTQRVRAEAGRAGAVRTAVEDGVAHHRVLVLHYRDGEGAASRREVEPQLLVRTADHEYLVAWCRSREAVRWFRLDRVESAETTAEAAPRRPLAGIGAPPAGDHPTHPAGRALRSRAPAARPRLVVLPGGRA
jgi:predicted DNA-binding transcriptional regulator YafY